MSAPWLVIEIDGAVHEVEAAVGETIFQTAHRHRLAPPFSCVSGYCGECVAVLEEGEVEMRVNRALSDRQLGRGLILTCQAVPRSPRCRVRYGE